VLLFVHGGRQHWFELELPWRELGLHSAVPHVDGRRLPGRAGTPGVVPGLSALLAAGKRTARRVLRLVLLVRNDSPARSSARVGASGVPVRVSPAASFLVVLRAHGTVALDRSTKVVPRHCVFFFIKTNVFIS
jgi:hypothetical protein